MSIKKRILGASVAIMLFAGCVGCGGGGGASTGSEPNSGGADLTTTSIYINSQSGNDKNDGTTPERALKSLDSMSYPSFVSSSLEIPSSCPSELSSSLKAISNGLRLVSSESVVSGTSVACVCSVAPSSTTFK